MSAPEFTFFQAGTAATFRAAAECIVPEEPESPGAGADLVLRTADRMLGLRPAADRKKVALFLRLLELLPWLRYGTPFSRLPPAKRERVLRFFERTRLHPLLRVGLFGIKTYVLMGYYGNELAWRDLDYPGPRALPAEPPA